MNTHPEMSTPHLLNQQQLYYQHLFEDVTLYAEILEFQEFEDCGFSRCAFRETHFHECKFLNCTFNDCEFQMTRVKECSLSGVKFEDSKLIGIDWTEASWPRRGLFTSIHFTNCVLNHSTFIGLNLQQMTLTRCTARDVDFSDANLTQADCTYTDFSQSRFMHTNLTQADFRGATHYVIAPNLNTLKQTKFSLPEAVSLLYSLDIILEE